MASASLSSSGSSLGSKLAVGSSIVKAAGQYQQSNASAAAAGYNANIALQNAATLRQNANLAGAIGDQNVGASEMATRAKVAGTLANQGASGVNVSKGSAVDVRQSEQQVGMQNALNIRAEAARRAYGLQTEADHAQEQAGLYKAEAKNDKKAGAINAATTVLGGIGKASEYTDYSKWLTKGGALSSITGDGNEDESEGLI